jgi:hypothetical protein
MLSEESRLEILKRAISTEEGWKALAYSIHSAPDSKRAKESAIALLRTMAGNKQVMMKSQGTDVPVSMAELLINELEKHLGILGL